MSVNIPTYMLASGMIAGGMNCKQAIFTVFLGTVLGQALRDDKKG